MRFRGWELFIQNHKASGHPGIRTQDPLTHVLSQCTHCLPKRHLQQRHLPFWTATFLRVPSQQQELCAASVFGSLSFQPKESQCPCPPSICCVIWRESLVRYQPWPPTPEEPLSRDLCPGMTAPAPSHTLVKGTAPAPRWYLCMLWSQTQTWMTQGQPTHWRGCDILLRPRNIL